MTSCMSHYCLYFKEDILWFCTCSWTTDTIRDRTLMIIRFYRMGTRPRGRREDRLRCICSCRAGAPGAEQCVCAIRGGGCGCSAPQSAAAGGSAQTRSGQSSRKTPEEEATKYRRDYKLTLMPKIQPSILFYTVKLLLLVASSSSSPMLSP